jgi:hypothetical protein
VWFVLQIFAMVAAARPSVALGIENPATLWGCLSVISCLAGAWRAPARRSDAEVGPAGRAGRPGHGPWGKKHTMWEKGEQGQRCGNAALRLHQRVCRMSGCAGEEERVSAVLL